MALAMACRRLPDSYFATLKTRVAGDMARASLFSGKVPVNTVQVTGYCEPACSGSF